MFLRDEKRLAARILTDLIQILFLTLTLLSWVLLIGLASSGHAGVTGSKHDFSGKGWGSNEICMFCHTPHNAKTDGGMTVYPLWNHTMSTATYTLYSSSSLKQTPLQPRGSSKLCLSCHDGTVATDSYGSHGGTQFLSGTSNLGTDLSNDHPISIYWDHQTLNGAVPCSNCHAFHGSLAYNLPFYNRYLECATCHEPHDKYPAYSNGKMLRKQLGQSAICLHCHGK
jgi:predicted CXXCH cytochrome family protein